MSWEVRSRTDPDRYLTVADGTDFTADDVTDTKVRLAAEQGFGLSPVGPFLTGIDTPAKLRAAAEWVIPAPRTTGDAPELPPTRPPIPGVVY